MNTKINFVPGEIWRDDRKPGDAVWEITDGVKTGITFVCPKCRHLGGVRFPPWKWDGNEVAPTVTNSILHDKEHCGWHGYLTAGEFIE